MDRGRVPSACKKMFLLFLALYRMFNNMEPLVFFCSRAKTDFSPIPSTCPNHFSTFLSSLSNMLNSHLPYFPLYIGTIHATFQSSVGTASARIHLLNLLSNQLIMLMPPLLKICTTILSSPTALPPFIFFNALLISSFTALLAPLSFPSALPLLFSPPTSLIKPPFSSWTKYSPHLISTLISRVNSSPAQFLTDTILWLSSFLTSFTPSYCPSSSHLTLILLYSFKSSSPLILLKNKKHSFFLSKTPNILTPPLPPFYSPFFHNFSLSHKLPLPPIKLPP